MQGGDSAYLAAFETLRRERAKAKAKRGAAQAVEGAAPAQPRAALSPAAAEAAAARRSAQPSQQVAKKRKRASDADAAPRRGGDAAAAAPRRAAAAAQPGGGARPKLAAHDARPSPPAPPPGGGARPKLAAHAARPSPPAPPPAAPAEVGGGKARVRQQKLHSGVLPATGLRAPPAQQSPVQESQQAQALSKRQKLMLSVHLPVQRPVTPAAKSALAFETDWHDHCETPFEAYRDVEPLLFQLALRVKRTKATLRIYDPYFCEGVPCLRGVVGRSRACNCALR
jgi:hypothetical protein